MAEVFLCFFWSLVIAVYAIPSIIYVAESKQLLNFPNERTTHLISVPRLGGLAIFAGFLSALMIFGVIVKEIQALLAGCIVLFYIAIKDDLVSVSAFKKFFVQILATGILVFIGNYRISNVHGLFGLYELEDGISYALTMVSVIAITNSVNLIDGINGLAGTLVVTISLIMAYMFWGIEQELPFLLVAVALAGSVIGFLRYNFHKASIFMGDSGSLICGFVVAALLIRFIEKSPFENSPVLAMSIVFVPIADTLRVTMIRLFNGKSPFTSDKNHIHHALLAIGLDPIAIVATLSTTNFLVFLLFIALQNVGITKCMLIFALVLVLTMTVFYFVKKKEITAGA